MKNRKNYVTTKTKLTLRQSGLLAVLLQRQRHEVLELAQRRAHGRQLRASLLEYPHSAAACTHGTNARRRFRQDLCGNRSALYLNLSPKQIAMSHQIHTYTELRQQIHDDLRIQHPEWVEPNGESSMCLMELLDTLTRRGSNESIAAPQGALEQGTKERLMEYDYVTEMDSKGENT